MKALKQLLKNIKWLMRNDLAKPVEKKAFTPITLELKDRKVKPSREQL